MCMTLKLNHGIGDQSLILNWPDECLSCPKKCVDPNRSDEVTVEDCGKPDSQISTRQFKNANKQSVPTTSPITIIQLICSPASSGLPKPESPATCPAVSLSSADNCFAASSSISSMISASKFLRYTELP